jgi:hypothetical protein
MKNSTMIKAEPLPVPRDFRENEAANIELLLQMIQVAVALIKADLGRCGLG